jgi:hypothetical protein
MAWAMASEDSDWSVSLAPFFPIGMAFERLRSCHLRGNKRNANVIHFIDFVGLQKNLIKKCLLLVPLKMGGPIDILYSVKKYDKKNVHVSTSAMG